MEITDDEARYGLGGNKPPLPEILAEQYKPLAAEVLAIAGRANDLGPKIKGGIKDEEALGVVAKLVTDAKALAKTVDEKRKAEKEPHLLAGREVDAFFGAFADRLGRIADAFTEQASIYQREQAAARARAQEAEARRLRDEEDRLRAQAERAKKPETADRKADEADEVAAAAAAAEAKAINARTEVGKVKTETGVTVSGKSEWAFTITDYEAIPLDKLRPYFQRAEVEKALRAFVKIHKGAAALPGVTFREETKAQFRA